MLFYDTLLKQMQNNLTKTQLFRRIFLMLRSGRKSHVIRTTPTQTIAQLYVLIYKLQEQDTIENIFAIMLNGVVFQKTIICFVH